MRSFLITRRASRRSRSIPTRSARSSALAARSSARFRTRRARRSTSKTTAWSASPPRAARPCSARWTLCAPSPKRSRWAASTPANAPHRRFRLLRRNSAEQRGAGTHLATGRLPGHATGRCRFGRRRDHGHRHGDRSAGTYQSLAPRRVEARCPREAELDSERAGRGMGRGGPGRGFAGAKAHLVARWAAAMATVAAVPPAVVTATAAMATVAAVPPAAATATAAMATVGGVSLRRRLWRPRRQYGAASPDGSWPFWPWPFRPWLLWPWTQSQRPRPTPAGSPLVKQNRYSGQALSLIQGKGKPCPYW